MCNKSFIKQTSILKIIFHMTLILLHLPSFALECHPEVDINHPQYLIGYGSLIDEESKQKTDPTAEKVFPILVKGFRRSWSIHGDLPGLNATFLSISKDPTASFNGVIYKINDSNMFRLYDNRETVYCREQLNATSFSNLRAEFISARPDLVVLHK